MVGRSQALQPRGPRFYDLADGKLKALHRWGDEWWVFYRTAGGEWASERELTIEDAVKIVVAAEKRYQPARLNLLERALDESVKLQSHYARLLNQYDGGERMTFESGRTWIERLVELDGPRKPPEEGSGDQER